MAVYIRKKANEDEKKKIFSDPARNIQILKQKLGDSMDVVIREFRLGNGQQAVAVYIDNLVSKEILGRDFFAPLMNAKKSGDWLLGEISQQVLKMGEIKELTSMEQLIAAILQGMTGLMIAGENAALIVEAVSWPQRSINEPATDVVIRGPREGFIESIRANVALLRRKIHHPDLQIEELMLGKYSQTTIGIIYVSSIVNRNVLRELKRRLKRIDIDGILDSGYIEQLIQDTPFSLFPTIGITEKPDIAAARILEGRVAVLIDGSPIALTVPMFFAEGLQSSEDYFTRFYYASWIRMIRVLAFLINIWLPGLFVAVVTWHQQIIPVRLFLSMAAAEANTPFAVGLAMLLILVAYEVLREAGVRLPKPAGQAISIVGAIIMGDAAISAGLISAP
ncbi:MAG: spore germination protein, partial [Clostridiales bacterium]